MMSTLFLYLLPLAALPVIFHLLFKGRVRVKRLPTLMFFTRIDPKMNSRRKIFKWLILLLRCAFLALLILALGRPVLQQLRAPGQSAARVVILDNSASMQGGGVGGSSLWQSALERGGDILRTGRGDDLSAVIGVVEDGFTKPSGLAATEKTERKLGAMQVTDGAGSIEKALERAVAMLSEHGSMTRQIHLISDFQKNQWQGVKPNVDSDITVVLHPLRHGQRSGSAVSIRGVGIGSGLRLAGQNVAVQLKLRADAGVSERIGFGYWQNNGMSGKAYAQVEGGREVLVGALLKDVLPGMNWYGLRLENHSGVSEAFGVFAAMDKRRVLLALSQERGRFIQRAFSPEGSGRLSGVVSEYVAPADLPGRLSDADVALVVVDAGGLNTVNGLKEFAARGGSVLVLPGSVNANIKSAEWHGGEYAGSAKTGKDIRLQLEDGSSVLSGVGGSELSGLGNVRINKMAKLELGKGSRVILATTDGQPVLSVKNYSEGRVILCSLNLDGTDSNFAYKPSFVVLMQSLVRLATGSGDDSRMHNVTAGKAINIAGLGGTLQVQELTAGSSTKLELKGLRSIPRRGVYAVQSKGGVWYVGVSPDFAESDDEYLELPEHKFSGLGEYKIAPLEGGAGLASWLSGLEGGFQLYPYLLVVALIMFALEGWLASGGGYAKSQKDVGARGCMALMVVNWYPAFDPAITVLIVLGLLIVTGMSVRKLYLNRGARIAVLIGVVRFLVLALLILAVFDPSFTVPSTKEHKSRVLLMVDDSESMSVARGESTRYAGASSAASKLVRDLPEFDFTFGVFDEQAKIVGQLPKQPSTSGTDFGRLYSWLRQVHAGGGFDHCVIISDGGDELPDVSEFPEFGVSILAVGASGGNDNVFIKELSAPSTVEPGEKILAKVILGADFTSNKFSGSLKNVTVNFERMEGDGKWKKLERKKIDLSSGSAALEFVSPVSGRGRFKYRVRLGKIAGDYNSFDNERAFTVESTDKKIRVLYFTTEFGRSYSSLRSALRTDAGVEFNALIRTVGGRYIYRKPSNSKGEMLKSFPDSVKELKEFDCIILGSFPADSLTRQQYKAIAEYVQSGGGLILMGGIHLAQLFSTDLKQILPWQQGNDAGLLSGEFDLRFSDPVAPSLQGFAKAVKDNNASLRSLSVVGSSSLMTEVLMSSMAMKREVPVLSLRQIKQGRVIGLATDSLWQLAQINAAMSKAVTDFWRQQIRSAARSEGKGGALAVSWDKPVYRPGERAEGEIVYSGDERVAFRAQLAGGGGKVSPQITTKSKNQAGISLNFPVGGEYRLNVQALDGGRVVGNIEQVFDVTLGLAEGAAIAVDIAGLERFAKSGGGIYASLSDYDDFRNRLRKNLQVRRKTENVRLVSYGPWYLVALLLCVCAEYYLRKRKGLV